MSEEKANVNFRLDKRRKRLAQALIPLLEKANLTEVMEAALDEFISEHMTAEMQAAILHRTNNHNHSHGDEDDPPSELPTARQPRAKSKAA